MCQSNRVAVLIPYISTNIGKFQFPTAVSASFLIPRTVALDSATYATSIHASWGWSDSCDHSEHTAREWIMKLTPIAKLIPKLKLNGNRKGCWLYKGRSINPNGYAIIDIPKTTLLHRWCYQVFVGP